MTLPASGALSLANIQSEFGGSNPIGINEYYRGGSFVPNSSLNSSIPTSGQITFNNFYNGSALAADNAFSGTPGVYSTGGKYSITSYGCGSFASLPNLTEDAIVTNNLLAIETIDSFETLGMSLGLNLRTVSATGYKNLYNTGLVRGCNINGVTYSLAPPPVNGNLDSGGYVFIGNTIAERQAQEAYIQASQAAGNLVTINFTY